MRNGNLRDNLLSTLMYSWFYLIIFLSNNFSSNNTENCSYQEINIQFKSFIIKFASSFTIHYIIRYLFEFFNVLLSRDIKDIRELSILIMEAGSFIVFINAVTITWNSVYLNSSSPLFFSSRYLLMFVKSIHSDM